MSRIHRGRPVAAVLVALVVAGCAPTQRGPAEWDGLIRQPDSRLDAVFLRPDAEIPTYGNIILATPTVCDTEEGRLSTAVRRAAGAQPYADHRALLDKANVDAVIIATPTHQHKDIALAAIQVGKHVYCESPLASSRSRWPTALPTSSTTARAAWT